MIKSSAKDTAKMLVTGALAGLAATVPMTAAMELMHRRLPARQRHPLPPRKVAMRAAGALGFRHELDEQERLGLTLAAHFGYGTTVGALYGPLAQRVPGPAVVKGMGYGLLVWAGSYLGLLPALGLLKPATEHAARRNALMITAHLVWGATLGSLTAWLYPLSLREREGVRGRGSRMRLSTRKPPHPELLPEGEETRARATTGSPAAHSAPRP